jgi:putative iron-dependent peroxidase
MSDPKFQRGILLPIPRAARYLAFTLRPQARLGPAMRVLAELADGERVVAGIGRPLARALGARIEGLRRFPSYRVRGAEVPATPHALWLWLRGEEAGELFNRSRKIERALAPAFRLRETVDAFRHGSGRDLTGYEDGTENPKGAKARKATLAADGSSFVAVQLWRHDFARFEAMSPKRRDLAIGRRLRDNEEIGDAPASAHVKRTAQEDYDPPAFMLRRSMPWTEGAQGGLVFVAFGATLYPFEAQLRRMVGKDDGIVDALFRFTRPLTGGYYWCPPLRGRRLDLRRLGIGT